MNTFKDGVKNFAKNIVLAFFKWQQLWLHFRNSTLSSNYLLTHVCHSCKKRPPEVLYRECCLYKFSNIFFLSGYSFTDTGNSQDSRGREGNMFYFSLPLQPAHEYSDIYLQLCMWDDYHVFVIASLVITRMLLDEIYHLIELPFDW